MLSHKLVFSESKNFTSGRWILAPPTIPINHYFSSSNQQNSNRSPILLFHANVFKCKYACFKHSNFFKVKDPGMFDPLRAQTLREERSRPKRHTRKDGRHGSSHSPRTSPSGKRASNQKSNYELFNCSNFNIRYWSWNYRGCWHQTCPPVDHR